jgi:hypothetical protein
MMGMGDESDPGKDVSGRWIGGLIALALVIWLVYMAMTGGFEGLSEDGLEQLRKLLRPR